jgi:hypothetical protein
MLRQRVTATGSLVLEGVLVLALVSATVFGLFRTVVSPVGLGGHVPGVVRDAGERTFGFSSVRYFGEVPAVRVELDQTVLVTTTPPLFQYGAQTIPVGRGEFSGPFEAQVNDYSPTTAQRAAFLGAGLAESVATIAVLLLLLLIVRTLRAGDPFVLANARRLRFIALAVVVGGTGASALQAWGAHLVLSDSAIAPFVHEHPHVTSLPLVAGLGVLLLAEVFRRGALMREDLEGLV